jgi:hypothetical protein
LITGILGAVFGYSAAVGAGAETARSVPVICYGKGPGGTGQAGMQFGEQNSFRKLLR